MAFPPAFAAFLRDYAAGRFFEAHEDLEALWRARDADPFLQGLILLAAAHVKAQRGSTEGARRHFASAAAYLGPFSPAHRGVDVAALLRHAAAAAGCPAVPVPAFPLLPGAEEAWEAPAPPPPAPDVLARAVAAAVAERRSSGAPVGPASWAPLTKDVVRRTGGRFPQEDVRAAVRAALAGTSAMPPRGGA